MSEGTGAPQRREMAAPKPAGRVLSASDYDELLATERAGHGASGGEFRNLPTLHDEARRHGYQQGLCRALLDVETTLREMRRCRDERDLWLEAYVLAILRKVLGDQEPASLVPALAEQAIAQCERGFDTLAVHVHPTVAADVAEQLRNASCKQAHEGTCIDVVADDRMHSTACEIHTPFGIIDAGLDCQLNALGATLTAAEHDEQ